MTAPGGRLVDRDTATAIESGRGESVRFVAHTSVYDEALIDGHWVGRYWSPAPTVKPEKDIEKVLSPLRPYLADAFDLELDGQALRGHWRWSGASLERGEHGTEVTVALVHAVRPVRIDIKTLLDGTAFIQRWLEITNTSSVPMALSRVSPFAGMIWRVIGPGDVVDAATEPFQVGTFKSDGWGREGEFRWTDLPIGSLTIDGIRGHSGWGRPTAFLQNRATGEFAVFDLEWSGNWEITVRHRRIEGSDQLEPPREAVVYLSGGPSAPSPQRLIEPGERLRTPIAHVANLRGGLDDAVQSLHEHVRRSVLRVQPEGRNQRIEGNHYGFVTDRISPDFLKGDIDVAASLGCEMYVLDAGWFGHEYGRWWASVGDWTAGPWLPGGVEEIRDYVRQRGLLFGLWIEPECVGNLSQILRDHPEWVLRRDDRPVVEDRSPDTAHYALNLTLPDVATWVEEQLIGIIERFDVDLVKLDHNMDFWQGGDTVRDSYVENTTWRHYEALYRILDRIRERHPKVILENCAGGGGRTDLGMMRRFDTTLLSDWVRLPRGLLILNGMSMVLPPEVCNRIAGWLSSSDERFGDLDTQLRVAILGHPTLFGVAPSVDEVPHRHRERATHAIELYKTRIRPMLSTSRVFHHTPEFDFERAYGHCVIEYAAPNGDTGVAAVFRLAHADDSYLFRPRGLNLGRTYRVTFDNSSQVAEVTGAALARDGVLVRTTGMLSSELLLFDAVE